MSSLTGLHTELVGFFSYSRQDDLDSDGTLSALRERIQRELRGQLGRSPMNFRLWQDKEAIAPGTLWESQIETGVGQSVFFIPIVTPTAVGSPQCRHEFNSFLAREAALERDDLIFPILYIGVPELEDEQQWRNHPVLRVIGLRQYVDWRSLRHLDVNATEVRIEIARFCEQIVRALRKPWLPPEERKRRDEETARQRAADEQRRAEDARRAEETARRRAEDEQRARAAEEQRRAQDARQAEEAARRRAEVARQREQLEAQRRADDARAQRELEARRRQQALEQLAAERQHRSRQTSAAAPAPHDRDAVDAEAPRSPSRRVIEAVALPLLVLALWQLAAATRAIDPLVLPAPTAILASWLDSIGSGQLARHVGSTLERFGAGFLVGAVLALALRQVIARLDLVRASVIPLARFLDAVPSVAYAPLAVLLFGFGIASGAVVTAIATFFPLLLGGLAGRTADAGSDSAGGLAVAAAAALLATLGLEMYAAADGLGYAAGSYMALFNVPALFSIVLSGGLLAALIHVVASRGGRLLAAWLRDPAGPLDGTIDTEWSAAGASRPDWSRVYLGAVAPIVLIIIWEAVVRGGEIPDFILPAPESVVRAWLALIGNGELPAALAATVWRLLAGTLIGLGLAVALWRLLQSRPRVGVFVRPLLAALAIIPAVLWVPPAGLWFGIGSASAVFASALGALFATLIALPAGPALPGHLYAAVVRGAVRIAFIVLMVAEFHAATSGLGYAMTRASGTFTTAVLFAYVLTAGALGLALEVAAERIATRVFR